MVHDFWAQSQQSNRAKEMRKNEGSQKKIDNTFH